MRYFSLFSGIGSFEFGFPDAWTCVGYSEIDKYAGSVYRYHYPKHEGYGDATGIDPASIPDFDMLCAGFPCQSFSVAGQRRGMAISFRQRKGLSGFIAVQRTAQGSIIAPTQL